MSQDQPFIWKSSLGWHRFFGDLQGKVNSVSQVDGISDMAPAFQLCGSVWGGFRKRTVASDHLDARHFSSSLYVTGAFQASAQVMELRGSESE